MYRTLYRSVIPGTYALRRPGKHFYRKSKCRSPLVFGKKIIFKILYFFAIIISLTTEKRLREEARREEEQVRKHTHEMSMNIMRARVQSAQLLLEGRSLSAKY